MEADELAALDSEGYSPLLALSHERAAPGPPSHAQPHLFVFPRGRMCWAKRQAQEGLMVELVAGRLGAEVGAAPDGLVVEVPATALPEDGSANHLQGVGVGLVDAPGAENLKDVSDLAPDGNVDPSKLDPVTLARVVTFQTWIGAEDAQVLVNFGNGRSLSIDHGTYRAVTSPALLDVVIAPRVPAERARAAAHVGEAVQRIEALSDEFLLEAVSRMPDAPEWRAEPERRFALAEALASRRDKLGEVMSEWSST